MPVLAISTTLPAVYTISMLSRLYMTGRQVGSGSRDSMHAVQAGCTSGWLGMHGFADGNNTFWTEQILFQNNQPMVYYYN